MNTPGLLHFLWGILARSSLAVSFQPMRFVRPPSSHSTQTALSSLDADSSESGIEDPVFYLRDAQFVELGQVADVIMSSFYVNSTNPWKQMFRIAELNRIQQGFPHEDKEIHRNIVAVAVVDGKEHVIGFCDLDNRLPNRNTGYSCNPRPYVSDLCISPQWRRKGIAKAIIQESEKYSREVLHKEDIYIRVESTNQQALNLYESLGYRQIHNPDSPKKQIFLLRKELRVEIQTESANVER